MTKQSAIQEHVTQKIIDALEAGTKPWVRPWEAWGQGTPLLPHNTTTGKAYNGINILLLWIDAVERGFSGTGYCTFKQAKAMGWKIKKGATSAKICHYTTYEKEVDDTETGETETVRVPSIKWFSVFNLDQIETRSEDGGLAPLSIGENEAFEDDMQAYVAASGLRVSDGGDEALYLPALDTIRMPKREQFVDYDNWAATLAHELVHSTGHPKRLERTRWIDRTFKEEGSRYAFEELVAELGAAFIGAQYGFYGEHLQHESYIASWLKHLKNDRRFIFKAAAKASQAQAYIAECAEGVQARAA